MKHGTAFIFLILIAGYIFADGGYCYKYKVKINMAQDSTIVAYYIHPDHDYEKRNITTLDFLFYKRNQSKKIKVYKDLHSLDSLGRVTYFACNKDAVLNITIKDIVSTEVLECYPCCPRNKQNFSDVDYGFCGMPVIEELTDDEIFKLGHKKPCRITLFGECFEIDLQNVMVISYNPDLTDNWILEKIRNTCCENYESYTKLNTQYSKVKEDLRSLGIILIKTSILN